MKKLSGLNANTTELSSLEKARMVLRMPNRIHGAT